MAPIKLKFLSSTNSLITLLISMLGFSTACKKEVLLMYGSPHATFKIIGDVKSAADGKVIPEIIVEVRKEYKEDTRSVFALIQTGFSEDNGTLNVTIGDYPDDQTYQLRFTDTDGALNGEFETLDTTVVFKDPKFTNGDGSWYSGVAEQEMNIKLKPKNN